MFDVSFVLNAGDAQRLYLMIRGQTMTFDFESATLKFQDCTFDLPSGDIDVRLLIDTTSVEMFVNQGRISAFNCFLPGAYVDPLAFHAAKGDITLTDIEIHELRSIWPGAS